MSKTWPLWAQELISRYGHYVGTSTTTVGVPREVFDYIAGRLELERLDDAEIGAP